MEEHTLECPRCGRVFSLELTRCPQCGLNIYPEEEEESGASVEVLARHAQAPGLGGFLGGLILGWILAGAVGFTAHLLLSRLGTRETLALGWKIILFLGMPVGAALGGYAASGMARLTRRASAGLGALVGLGAAALALLFETLWRLVTPQVMLEALMLAQYALCLLLGGLGAWLSSNRQPEAAPGGESAASGLSWEDLMYRDLLTRVRYNRDTAERLIEYERRQTPQAERYTLLRNAIDRLEKDRR